MFNSHILCSRLRLKLKKKLEKMRAYRIDRTRTKFFHDLLDDLHLSSSITLFIYFVFYVFIYILVYFNHLNDPAQLILNSNICISEPKTTSKDLVDLSTRVNSILSKSNEKYFLCYRSLIYILKLKNNLYDQDYLDLCLYDTTLTPHDVKSNLNYILGYSKLDANLNDLANKDPNFTYEFNSFYGYFKFKYRKAEIFLYLYIHAPPTRLEFDSITRSGLLYTQFSQVIKKFYSSTNITNNYKISLLNKMPIYMVNEMMYKINVTNVYVYLPTEPYNSLMYFYPSIWWLTSHSNNKFCIF